MSELNLNELDEKLTDMLVHAFYGYECHIKGEDMPSMDKMRDLAYKKYLGTAMDYANYDPKSVIECNVMRAMIKGLTGNIIQYVIQLEKESDK